MIKLAKKASNIYCKHILIEDRPITEYYMVFYDIRYIAKTRYSGSLDIIMTVKGGIRYIEFHCVHKSRTKVGFLDKLSSRVRFIEFTYTVLDTILAKDNDTLCELCRQLGETRNSSIINRALTALVSDHIFKSSQDKNKISNCLRL